MLEIDNKELLNRIIDLLEEAREKAIRSVDFHRVQLNWTQYPILLRLENKLNTKKCSQSSLKTTITFA
jgi:hypothetical protein